MLPLMKVTHRRSPPEPTLELAPLLDVMFLLLTFFIFAFVIMVRLEVTDIRLPTASTGRGAERVPTVTLALNAEGEVTIKASGFVDLRFLRTPEAD